MRRHAAAALVLFFALCLIYLPDIGHGFIKDDFMWIRTSRIHSSSDAVALFCSSTGFYRPLVSATFAMNYALSGVEPFGYGLTNFVLLVVDACLVFALARVLNLTTASSLLAAALWSFSFHGVNMALLWVSGRTALLLCLGALLTGLSVLKGRMRLAGVFCLLALLSKEEAVALPFLFTAWFTWEAEGPVVSRVRQAITRSWPLYAALVVYAALRLQTDAFGPVNAPSYYRFTLAPGVLLRNLFQYFDREVTWPAVVTGVIVAVTRSVPRLNDAEWRATRFGALWLVFGGSLTILLPVRSSLYALLPSIGACLAASAVASAAARTHPERARKALTALVILPIVLLPVYRARNVRWVALADLSSHVMAETRRTADAAPTGGQIILLDDPDARANLDGAFGALFPDAVALIVNRGFRGEIRQEPTAMPTDGQTASAVLLFRLRAGRLVQSRR
jgi:hypothetical protein